MIEVGRDQDGIHGLRGINRRLAEALLPALAELEKSHPGTRFELLRFDSPERSAGMRLIVVYSTSRGRLELTYVPFEQFMDDDEYLIVTFIWADVVEHL